MGEGAGPGPAVVIDWLRRAGSGGVHLVDRSGTRYTPWSGVLRDVLAVAGHLTASGVRPGMRIGIRGHNSYEWLVLDLALLHIGAIAVAIPIPDFADRSNAEVSRQYGLTTMFAASQGRFASDDDAIVVPLEKLLDLPPVAPLSEVPPPQGERVPLDDREVFTLAFSSGTTGRVKCLLLAWSGVEALIEAYSATYPLRPSDRIMIALPLSTFQQRYLSYLAIRYDCGIVLTTAAHFLLALPAARPTILLGPPNFYDFVEARYRNLGRRRRALLDRAASAAVLLPSPALRRRWRRFVFRSLHAMYGGSMRLMLVGSAPVREGMLRFFARAGFELYQIYGMTETGFLTWNRPGANRIGSVGRDTYPGTVFLGKDGEVLIRHPWHVCVGYEGEPADEVAKVLRGDDVIATGDLGQFDGDGFLYLKGRKKNIIVTTGGQKIQLEDLESDLCRAAGVSQAALCSIGDEPGLAMVAWYEGDASAVRAALRSRLDQVNARLGPDVRIRRVALIEGVLAPDSPLLNRNLKLNREVARAASAHLLQPIEQWTTNATYAEAE